FYYVIMRAGLRPATTRFTMIQWQFMKKGANSFFGQLVTIYFLSRLMLLLIGLLAMFYFPSARSLFPIADLQYHRRQPNVLEMWTRWDSEWYLLIAEKGYRSYESFKDFGHGKYLPQDATKFFPAYPIGIRLLTYVTRSSVLSGWILSNVAALAFLFYFYSLTSNLIDKEAAFGASLFYIFFPTSFFFNAVYSESLFLAALLAGFYYIEKKNLFAGCAAIALAILTRPQGLLALPALLWLVIRAFPQKKALAGIAMLLAAIIPFAGYLIFLNTTFGSSQWFALSQNYWRGESRYPLYALVRFFQSDIAIHGQHNSIIDFSFAMFHLLILALSFRMITAPYWIYSLLILLVPLSSSLFSFSRLGLVNFPLFIYLGGKITGRWSFALQTLFAMLLTFFMAAFANWFWVG
ncbi:MAG TPA: mannosyltransferase family protein, partial [Acidobacteriota bacterium]|nr:mannosyltransferase family protein [Acidobacteriota bacterium]